MKRLQKSKCEDPLHLELLQAPLIVESTISTINPLDSNNVDIEMSNTQRDG